MALFEVTEAQRESVPDAVLSMFCRGFPFWKRGLWESLSHVVEQAAKSREAFGSGLGPDIMLAQDCAGIWVFHSHIAGLWGWQHRWGSEDS